MKRITDLLDVITYICTAFGKSIDAIDTETYEHHLRGYSLEVLVQAINVAVRERTFLPSVAELLDFVRRVQPVMSRAPFEACDRCNRTGWIETSREQSIDVGRAGD